MITRAHMVAVLVPLALVACSSSSDDVHHAADGGADGAPMSMHDASTLSDASGGGADAAAGGASISINFKIDGTVQPQVIMGFTNPKIAGYLDYYAWAPVPPIIYGPILGSAAGVIEGTLTIGVGPVATVTIVKPPMVSAAAIAEVNAGLTMHFDHAEGSPNPDRAHILMYRTGGAWTDADEAALAALGVEITPIYVGKTGVATGWGDYGGLILGTTLPQIHHFSI